MPNRNKPRRSKPSIEARQKLPTTDQLKRFWTMFLLEKLTSQLRSDVLSDGAISAKSGLAMQHSVRFNEQLVLTRKSVFAAFGAAGAGRKPQPLRDLNGKTVRAKVWVDKEGHGYVQIKKQSIRFEFGGLTTSDTAQRVGFAEAALKSHTLAGEYSEHVLALAKKPGFSHQEFFEIAELLASSPELFAARLNRNLISRRIGVRELIPEDVRYWDNLTAILKVSRSLVEFNANELEHERKLRLARDPAVALRSISLTFPAPSLVPVHLFKDVDSAALEMMLSASSEVDDHFALIGLFELCVNKIAENKNMEKIGTQMLTRLIGDMDRLAVACNMFGAAFIVATAYLVPGITNC